MLGNVDVQDKLDKAVSRYFNRLFKVGYVSYQEVESILILDYINDIIRECDVNAETKSLLSDVLSCINGTCLIPYNTCNKLCNN